MTKSNARFQKEAAAIALGFSTWSNLESEHNKHGDQIMTFRDCENIAEAMAEREMGIAYTAAAVWEHVESCPPEEVAQCMSNAGYATARDFMCKMAIDIHELYNALPLALRESTDTYDWDFIPWIISNTAFHFTRNTETLVWILPDAQAIAAHFAPPESVNAEPEATDSAATLALFFIAAATDNGDSLDLLVSAYNATEAVKLWRANYELDSDDSPTRVFTLPPMTGEAKALAWFKDVTPVTHW